MNVNLQMQGKPNLEVFAETLEALAGKDRDLVVVTSDSRGSGKLGPFGEKYPEQLVETGIAEQNLVGISAGLASTGKKVFAVSPACFLTARSLEQIKNDVAYADHPVRLIGISAGVSYGALGSTHHSLHDFAVLRAVHNITIIAPADNVETRKAIEMAYTSNKPVYIRFGKKSIPVLHDKDVGFAVGRGITIRDGKDLAIIATGECVVKACAAAIKLEADLEISTRVISMHTLKPMDQEILFLAASECGALITVEEHSIFGGLGEACASLLLENGFSIPFKIMGIPDEYTIPGSQDEIFKHYGLSAEGISVEALKLLKKKKTS
jgi:transketolase